MSSGAQERYRLSSQQCAAYAAGWQDKSHTHVVLAEGPSASVNLGTLRSKLTILCRRHESLRTCYRPAPGLRYPLQEVVHDLAPAVIDREAGLTDEELMAAARSSVKPLTGPVVVAVVAASGDGRTRLAVAVPAFALDAVALQELALLCTDEDAVAASATGPDTEAMQYLDYAAWQEDLLASALGREGERFWQAQLEAPGYPQHLPFEGEAGAKSPAVATSRLSPPALQAIAALAQGAGLPVERAVLALWAGFLARLAQEDSVSFDWRLDTRTEELAGMLGTFTMKLPVSVKVNQDLTAEALIRSVDDQLQSASAWQECFSTSTFDDTLLKERKSWHGVEFAHVRLLNRSDGWSCRHVDLETGTARLRCEFVETEGQAFLRWSGTDVYSVETIETWRHQFSRLLDSLSRDPQRPLAGLSMSSDRELGWIGDSLNAGRKRQAHGRQETLQGLFEYQAERRPESVAVVWAGERVTYRDLNERADRLAGRLQSIGIGAECVVGVYLNRSIDVISAMLAVMKAGAAYLPLDPSYPPDRIDGMLTDAKVSALIVESTRGVHFPVRGIQLVAVDDVDSKGPHASAKVAIAGDQLAYMIYTSGSTGRPKGVMVSHANAVASTRARFEFYAEPVSRFLMLSSPSFDSSVAGIFWTLGQGGTLYMPHEDLHKDPVRIAELMEREAISHVLTLPSLYKQILEERVGGKHLRCAIVAGEACHSDVVAKHRTRVPGAVLVNEYGPTEGTVWSNAYQAVPVTVERQRIPIGRPIPSMRGWVLDEQLERCAVGIPGEWYIGGEGITRGYHGRPELTAQRFVADPFQEGQRLYRTGDRVRLRPDGQLEYLGRVDHQVKLRGHRIELGEIEQCLLAQQGVKEAVVLVQGSDGPAPRLVAYAVSAVDASDPSKTTRPPLAEALDLHLRRHLPAFMVPNQIVLLEQLPLMPNGKVDRQALQDRAPATQRPPYRAPTDEVERVLTGIWQAVLEVDEVGLDDNFFELGGHSLLTVKLVSSIRNRLQTEVPLAKIFDYPTVDALAAYLKVHKTPPTVDASAAGWVQTVRRGVASSRVPLFCFPGLFVNSLEYEPIWSALESERSLYGFACHTLSPGRWEAQSMERLVAGYVAHIRAIAGEGPVALLGWSTGGDLAFEAARQLRSTVDVRFVGLLDVCVPLSLTMKTKGALRGQAEVSAFWEEAFEKSTMSAHWKALLQRLDPQEASLAADHVLRQHRRMPLDGAGLDAEEYRAWAAINYSSMLLRYGWPQSEVATHVWIAAETLAGTASPVRDWSALSRVLEVSVVPECDHRTLLRQPQVLQEIRAALRRVDAPNAAGAGSPDARRLEPELGG